MDSSILEVDEGGTVERLNFSDPRAFDIISRAWLRIGWDTKYVYSFTWLGRPIFQLPEDLIRVQEVVYRIKPDVIVEIGVAHGGSLVFYASLCKAMGKGRVIGIDIEIRPHNRAAIEAHELAPYIRLVEGDSVDPGVVRQVRALIHPDETALIVLDGRHTKAHVLAELRAYGPLVSMGSYIVACDGIMEQLVAAPRSQPDWAWNNPRQAAVEFAAECPGFVNEPPGIPFNEGTITQIVSYWQGGWLRRVATVRDSEDSSVFGSAHPKSADRGGSAS